MAHALNHADKQTLITFLKGFYSLGQLQWIYFTLTDDSPLPDISEFERQARAEAIAEILKEAKKAVPQRIEEPVSVPVSVPATETRIPLDKAQRLAKGLVERLEEYCDRIHIAGSIRRLKPEVKDIEIVCQPKTFVEADFSLFGSGSNEVKVIPAFIREVETLGLRVIKGQPTGRYMQIEAFRDIKLDLFMPQASDFYRQLAIRTGSADYAAKVIATGWKKLGWCGTDQGLRLVNECEETKSGWRCIKRTPTLPPVWQSEREFFSWLGIPAISPPERI
ncbi:nucleotidyltransferase family protein [Spirosoma aerophilum]